MVELKVVTQEDNKIIGRKEIIAEMPFEGPTPPSKDVQNWVAKQFKTEPKQVVVEHIYTKYGTTSAVVHAKVYDTLETVKALENLKEEKKPEAEKKEEKHAETESPKTEEKQPESKTEIPKEEQRE